LIFTNSLLALVTSYSDLLSTDSKNVKQNNNAIKMIIYKVKWELSFRWYCLDICCRIAIATSRN